MAPTKQAINDIKSLKVQGAENVAIAAVSLIRQVLKESKHETPEHLLAHLETIKSQLFDSRPTEPCMRNAVNFLLSSLKTDDIHYLKAHLDLKIQSALAHFEEAKARIAEYGARKIPKNSTVFTHCHSSAVISILKKAKLDGKKFAVHNTETRPLLQGRLTAKELSSCGIPVTMFVDSAARLALKRADIMLIGADAITSEGKVINKIGSELFAEVANKYEIPVYICTDSWKFDPLTIFGYEETIEERGRKEIWPDAPKSVDIDNHAFEKIEPDLITGIISELGVYKTHIFIEEIRRNYRWIFE